MMHIACTVYVIISHRLTRTINMKHRTRAHAGAVESVMTGVSSKHLQTLIRFDGEDLLFDDCCTTTRETTAEGSRQYRPQQYQYEEKHEHMHDR